MYVFDLIIIFFFKNTIKVVIFWLEYADCILFMTMTQERRREQKERAEEMRSETDIKCGGVK